ncbi:LysE family translocator [Shewanella yunxiaonensis]|uniref:LysE family translocator n=1 Tax=Shewanella yunxiaonensis TaxID=2829809 RepID=A0ABX7YYZ2_9GAMM|nr:MULTISPECIES: LysE family translocator [Shewanella]MDF0534884.1 LysE family translocator [Shewanella sp. A32]QUN07271.1 LysE family translocator [Shewanella yunxiaonensis]
MQNYSLLAAFIPTFFLVSATPGMCMTLAMTLGMSIGVRRTLWMMLGELTGVALVAVASALGVAALMLQHPQLFQGLKYLGGAYLIWLGFNMWRAKAHLADNNTLPNVHPYALMSQGFITAIANPKGWAFMISLLPPFIDANAAIAPQLSALVGIIMLTEFGCLMAYASGGKGLRLFLSRGNNIRWMNRVSGALMIAVGLWLALD